MRRIFEKRRRLLGEERSMRWERRDPGDGRGPLQNFCCWNCRAAGLQKERPGKPKDLNREQAVVLDSTTIEGGKKERGWC
jgi:hypothetical protein